MPIHLVLAVLYMYLRSSFAGRALEESCMMVITPVAPWAGAAAPAAAARSKAANHGGRRQQLIVDEKSARPIANKR